MVGKKRVVTWIAGLATVGVVALVVAYGDDILHRYALYRLRSDPDYLREAVMAEKDSLKGRAVRVYLEDVEAQERLFGRIWEGWIGPEMRRQQIPQAKRRWKILVYCQRTRGIGEVPAFMDRAVQLLKNVAEGREYSTKDYLDLRFSFGNPFVQDNGSLHGGPFLLDTDGYTVLVRRADGD